MRILVLTTFLFCCITTKSQLPFKITNEISPVLSKVIHDYPNGFNNIKGTLIEEGPQVTNFACLLIIKGIEEPGIITKFGQEKDRVYSWKNVMLETEDFETAKRMFKQYYTQIKKTSTVINDNELKLSADYIEPDENKNFNTILFNMESAETSVKECYC